VNRLLPGSKAPPAQCLGPLVAADAQTGSCPDTSQPRWPTRVAL
jgi:hypothetical protein